MVRIHPDPPGSGNGTQPERGCSSIGRAPALQAGGRRFDPVQLHQFQVSGIGDQASEEAARCGTRRQEIRRQRRGRCCRLAFLASRIGCSLTIWEGKASVELDESFAEAKGLSCILALFREHKRREAGRRKHACSGGLREQDAQLWGQATKCMWWMPWRSQAMKDVAACEKLRGAGKRALIRRYPNGETRPARVTAA